jgi:hypothetical protein
LYFLPIAAEDEMSAECELSCTVYDYQKQSILWMIGQELNDQPLSQCLWIKMKFTGTNKSYYYSPYLHKFHLIPLSDVKGGWCAGKLIILILYGTLPRSNFKQKQRVMMHGLTR